MLSLFFFLACWSSASVQSNPNASFIELFISDETMEMVLQPIYWWPVSLTPILANRESNSHKQAAYWTVDRWYSRQARRRKSLKGTRFPCRHADLGCCLALSSHICSWADAALLAYWWSFSLGFADLWMATCKRIDACWEKWQTGVLLIFIFFRKYCAPIKTWIAGSV